MACHFAASPLGKTLFRYCAALSPDFDATSSVHVIPIQRHKASHGRLAYHRSHYDLAQPHTSRNTPGTHLLSGMGSEPRQLEGILVAALQAWPRNMRRLPLPQGSTSCIALVWCLLRPQPRGLSCYILLARRMSSVRASAGLSEPPHWRWRVTAGSVVGWMHTTDGWIPRSIV